MKKQLSRIAAVGVAVFMLAGCGGQTTEEGPGLVDPSIPNVDAGGDDELEEPDGRPTAGFNEHVMDLGGREIVILDSHSQWFNYHETIDLTPNETLTVMDIMREIGDDFNTSISVVPAPAGGEIVAYLTGLRAAGLAPYDMLAFGTTGTNLESLYSGGIVMDMNHPLTVGIIDFYNNPWDPESALGYFHGRRFGVHFKVLNSGHLVRSTTVFNRTFMDTFALPNLYEMVFNKTWTWNNFETVSNQVIQASGGSVRPLTYNRESQLVPAIIASNGGRVAENTPTGLVFVAHEDENTLEALGWFQAMINQGIITRDTGMHQNQQLAEGLTMFHFVDVGALRALTRQYPYPSEFNFGLLPMPMGPQMTEYASVSFAAHTYHIFNDIYRPDQVAAVLVAMANRLTRTDIIEHELNYGVQDEYSARVIELLLERTVIDHSRIIGAARSTLVNANQRVETGVQTPVAAMQTIAAQIQVQYDAISFD